jgi:hypothetical protein
MTTDIYQQLDACIKENDLGAMLARWECGKHLLAERGEAGRLPNGRLEELSNALDVSRSELNNRMRFAIHTLSEADVQTALTVYGSWFAICRDSLKARLTDNEPGTANTPELESKRLYEAINALRVRTQRLLREECDDPLLDLILRDRRYLDAGAVRSLFDSFRDLRNRLATGMEALRGRMNVRMDEELDSLGGHTLLELAHDRGKGVVVESPRRIQRQALRRSEP